MHIFKCQNIQTTVIRMDVMSMPTLIGNYNTSTWYINYHGY